METLKFIIAGKLQRDYFITADEKTVLDVLGGNLPYAAVGFKIWEDSPPPGLMARVGEDFPYRWLTDLESGGFDIRGINILPEAVDVRNFYIYTDKATRVTGDPVPHFARLGELFPKALLGYRDQSNALDSKTSMGPVSLRQGDIPEDYLDATAAHICPIDYLTHSLLPATFRQAGFTNITLDPSSGYMNPTYFNDVPSIVTGLTAFMPSEEELRSLFQGRSDDLWEMAETLATYGCEFIVITRLIQPIWSIRLAWVMRSVEVFWLATVRTTIPWKLFCMAISPLRSSPKELAHSLPWIYFPVCSRPASNHCANPYVSYESRVLKYSARNYFFGSLGISVVERMSPNSGSSKRALNFIQTQI